ncbi:MAG TPA: hypothetical protein VFH78_06570 [Candidatus Thermoplasmatota archaeon]|nr:hypothetical protein [Candidatus Thermoplasmatota archaeon]
MRPHTFAALTALAIVSPGIAGLLEGGDAAAPMAIERWPHELNVTASTANGTPLEVASRFEWPADALRVEMPTVPVEISTDVVWPPEALSVDVAIVQDETRITGWPSAPLVMNGSFDIREDPEPVLKLVHASRSVIVLPYGNTTYDNVTEFRNLLGLTLSTSEFDHCNLTAVRFVSGAGLTIGRTAIFERTGFAPVTSGLQTLLGSQYPNAVEKGSFTSSALEREADQADRLRFSIYHGGGNTVAPTGTFELRSMCYKLTAA